MVDDANKKDDDKIEFGQLTEALKSLPQGVQDAVKTAIREVSGEQAAAHAAAKAAADDDAEDGDNDIDLERLSRSELVNFINKGLSKTLSKVLKPIQDRLESTSTDAEVDRVRREFAKANEDFPDFMEWKEEMRGIISLHPELSAEDVYLLARAKNPDKVKEVNEKLQEGKGEKDEKALSERKRAFGGLTPTSGISLEKDGKKQPKEAAGAAWDEVFGQVDKELLEQTMEG